MASITGSGLMGCTARMHYNTGAGSISISEVMLALWLSGSDKPEDQEPPRIDNTGFPLASEKVAVMGLNVHNGSPNGPWKVPVSGENWPTNLPSTSHISWLIGSKRRIGCVK